MKKKNSPFIERCQYLAVRIFAGILSVIPLPLAVMIGKGLGLIFHALDKRHRVLCIQAMQKALYLDADDAAALTRKVYLHFGIMLVEFPRLPKINQENINQHVEWGDGVEELEKLLADGKGVILCGGHIGNWEACGYILNIKNICSGAVARPLDNPLIDNWVRNVRESQGHEIWDKFGALRSATRTLKEGKAFGILMDQDGGRDGVFNTFFNIPCSTWPTVADLAMRSGAAVVAIAMHRRNPMHFTLELGKPFYAHSNPADMDEERRRILQLCNDELERIIRKRPEQWLWLHRRWKTQEKK